MNLQILQKKKKELKRISNRLKNHFVGIDHIIDQVIKNIEVWYIMPEILERPIIINLWGITGVGKTDLVRRLVSEIDYEERFVEIQLDTGKSSPYERYSIKQEFDSMGINKKEPSILLLDEIQRFNSIDEKGMAIENSKYQDIWMILSDGKFNNKDVMTKILNEHLMNLLFDKDWEDNNDDSLNGEPNDDFNLTINETPKKGRKYKGSVWASKFFKSDLELTESLSEIMTWDVDKKISIIDKKLKDIRRKKNIDNGYRNLLIFVSGNIDEAYSMSNNVEDVSTDADIYHELSKQINIFDIKRALSNKFKPEQIARLGNTHLIYPILNKSNYQELINKKVLRIKEKLEKRFNIHINFHQSVYDAIYENGVFPIQGVRPLFTTISSVIENSIPYLLMEIMINKGKYLDVKINDLKIIGIIKNENNESINEVERDIILDVTSIKKNINKNLLAMVAVHEAAHAVLYAVEYNRCPSQIIATLVNNKAYNIITLPMNSYNLMLSHIRVLLAGNLGEKIVFGKKSTTGGNIEDLQKATEIASAMVRRYNMTKINGSLYIKNHDKEHNFIYDTKDSNKAIVKIIKEEKANSEKKLIQNNDFFKEIIEFLIKNKEMNSEQFHRIGKKYLPNLENMIINDQLCDNYDDKLEHYLKL